MFLKRLPDDNNLPCSRSNDRSHLCSVVSLVITDCCSIKILNYSVVDCKLNITGWEGSNNKTIKRSTFYGYPRSHPLTHRYPISITPHTVMLGGIPPSIYHGRAWKVASHGMPLNSLMLVLRGFDNLQRPLLRLHYNR